MTGYEIEIILTRQWADSLSIPVFLTDPAGNLLFYNAPAEQILGKRFEDTGAMPVNEWSTIFTPKDHIGETIPPSDLPLVRTLTTQEPAQGAFYIDSLDGSRHFINVTSFPIIGMSGGYLGAVAIFWTKEEK